MREKLSKRAQKFYRTNPEAYLELKEIEQRGTRICPGCEKEVELSLLECPECGHILRTSRWKDAWKWILGATLLLLLGSGGFMILFFGNIPACDDPEVYQRLRGEFDHSLYATTLKLVSDSVMYYGPTQGMRLFQDRNCRALIETSEGAGVHVEYFLEHRLFQHHGMTMQIIPEQ